MKTIVKLSNFPQEILNQTRVILMFNLPFNKYISIALLKYTPNIKDSQDGK